MPNEQPTENDQERGMALYMLQEQRRKAEGRSPHGTGLVIGLIVVLCGYAVLFGVFLWG